MTETFRNTTSETEEQRLERALLWWGSFGGDDHRKELAIADINRRLDRGAHGAQY